MTVNPQIILFDWDGTLVDSFAFLESAHNNALAVLKLPSRSEQWFKAYFGKPRDFIYQDIYGRHDPQARELFEGFVNENHKKLLNTMDGSAEILKQIQSLNVPMGVVSNKKSAFIHAEVTHLGWDNYFKCVVGSGDAAEDKPSAEPIYEALRQADYDGDISDVLYVGDTEADMQTAQNAGCPWVLITTPSKAATDWALSYPPLMTLSNCEQFAKYLLQS